MRSQENAASQFFLGLKLHFFRWQIFSLRFTPVR